MTADIIDFNSRLFKNVEVPQSDTIEGYAETYTKKVALEIKASKIKASKLNVTVRTPDAAQKNELEVHAEKYLDYWLGEIDEILGTILIDVEESPRALKQKRYIFALLARQLQERANLCRDKSQEF